MCADLLSNQPAPREGYVSVENPNPSAASRLTWLYYREIGQGQPIIILHGGPDFDHAYLLPDMDRLSDSFRLIYYDQRGRGKSAGDVRSEDIGIESEIEDLEALIEHFQSESVVVLGHSWGALIAMEYAIRHPHRVSHLILMNPAPASHDDYTLFRQVRHTSAASDLETMAVIASTASYQDGDLEADAAYYRIHFRATLRDPERLERLVKSLRLNFTKEGVLKARAIEQRLYNETWLSSEYNLLPKLMELSTPTLVIYGDHDFIPMDCAAHIAQAIPGARLVLLRKCGHFSFLECPEQSLKEISNFVRGI